jgi:hypothetical protein
MSAKPKINFYGTVTVTARVEVEVEIPIELAVTKRSVIEEGYCRPVEDGDPSGWYDYVEAYINENGLGAIKGFEIAESDADYVRNSLVNAAEEWQMVAPEHHQPPETAAMGLVGRSVPVSGSYEVGSETSIVVTDVRPI